MKHDKKRAKFAQLLLKRISELESDREHNYSKFNSQELTEKELEIENKFIAQEIEQLTELYRNNYINWEVR